MQELTKKTVTKLLKDTSHALHVADFDDIEELDKLADKVVNQSPEERRLLNQPFELCGIKFYPLTIAKSLWFAEKCEEWDIKQKDHDLFLFWLLTLPLNSECLDEFSSRSAAGKAIKRVSRSLHCTVDEMETIVERCIGSKSSSKNANDDKTNYGAIISILLREYGGTPEQWLYEMPVPLIASFLDQYTHKVNAESSACESRSAKGGKAVAPAPSAKLIALKDFNTKMNQIKQKWVTNGL